MARCVLSQTWAYIKLWGKTIIDINTLYIQYELAYAHISLMKKLYNPLDQGNIALTLDLTKTFNTVNHSILLSKLYKYSPSL